MGENEEQRLHMDRQKAQSSVIADSQLEHHRFLAVGLVRKLKNSVRTVVIFQGIATVYYPVKAGQKEKEWQEVSRVHNDRMLQPREKQDTYQICSQGTLSSSQKICCISHLIFVHTSTTSVDLPCQNCLIEKKKGYYFNFSESPKEKFLIEDVQLWL